MLCGADSAACATFTWDCLVSSQAAAANEQKLVVVSVSPQSRASLAARCKMGLLETAKKLTTFLKSLGKCGIVF